MQRSSRCACIAYATAIALAGAAIAKADPVGDFYKGKIVELDIASSAGGAYDAYARAIARFLGDHIPGNPKVVPKNAPGAGGLKLAVSLYNTAPRDGTVIGAVIRGTVFEPTFGNAAAQFDGNKFGYIGSANDEVSTCVAWRGTGVTRLEDLYVKQLTVGGTGPGADTDVYPLALNGVLGTKLKLITGYPGGNDINLAMERSEVGGRCGISWSTILATRPDWVADKKVAVFVQLALKKHRDLPDVPLVMDFAKTDEQTKMLRLVFARQSLGRPFIAPPDVPAERIAALRQAFMATMRDDRFLADAQDAKLEIEPVAGEELQDLVRQSLDVPPALASKVAGMLK
jgi:tripartite-type tricarboxylate transporter receptor subunit TctC